MMETDLGRAHGLRTFGLALTRGDNMAHLADTKTGEYPAHLVSTKKVPEAPASKAPSPGRSVHNLRGRQAKDEAHSDMSGIEATAAATARIAAKNSKSHFEDSSDKKKKKKKSLPSPQQAWVTHFGRAGGPVADLAKLNPPVPEPEFPRIAPTGTGISLRPYDIPPASLENIRNACQFYELKSSGKYSSKTLVGRYIFQLSREVQRQVVALEKADTAKTRRISYLEELVRDWEETFGHPSEDDLERVFNGDGPNSEFSPLLTPSRLAKVLRERLDENSRMKTKMEHMEKNRQNEIEKAQKAIGDHFRANREQFRLDSERLHAEIEAKRAALEKEEREKKQANEKYLQEMTSKIEEQQRLLLHKERSEIASTVARKVEQGLRDAVARSNAAILKTEAERRNRATEYLRKLAEVQKREEFVDDRIMGLRDKHAKEIASLKARHARLLEDTAKRVKGNNEATLTSIANVEMENKWLRRRVADLQEIVEAFQDSLGLAAPPGFSDSGNSAERSLHGALV